jgi:hypothetical protein
VGRGTLQVAPGEKNARQIPARQTTHGGRRRSRLEEPNGAPGGIATEVSRNPEIGRRVRVRAPALGQGLERRDGILVLSLDEKGQATCDFALRSRILAPIQEFVEPPGNGLAGSVLLPRIGHRQSNQKESGAEREERHQNPRGAPVSARYDRDAEPLDGSRSQQHHRPQPVAARDAGAAVSDDLTRLVRGESAVNIGKERFERAVSFATRALSGVGVDG